MTPTRRLNGRPPRVRRASPVPSPPRRPPVAGELVQADSDGERGAREGVPEVVDASGRKAVAWSAGCQSLRAKLCMSSGHLRPALPRNAARSAPAGTTTGRRDARSATAGHGARSALACARDGVCVRCGSTRRLHVHHRIPLRYSGSDDIGNLAALRCHGQGRAN
jgi:hypothetical protein